ncbi:MAG: TRAP transporter small permease [Deltaproteobacteria bacterium]|nr:TRAP transporter small permease [Deltaproteobacteria bacterium]
MVAVERYRKITALCGFVDSVSLVAGKLSSYVIGLVVLMMSYEVVSRYVFNAPTIWSGELCQYGLCFATMLGGGYTLMVDKHIRVDIIYRKFNFKKRAVVELATWWVVIGFLVVLTWKGGELAIDAYLGDEKSMAFLEVPMVYSLSLIPIGSALLLLQAITRLIRNILNLLLGKEEFNLVDSHF